MADATNEANTPPTASQRLLSLDAYRGFTMLLMATHSPFVKVAKEFPDSSFWQFMAFQFDHLPWVGCTVWDMIQPSFMFMVGVSMVYSLARREAEGASWTAMLGHAVWRAVALVLLGVFLRSRNSQGINWTFEDVLTQIGLGYVFLFLLWGRSWRVQVGAIVLILVGYWALFAFWPLPSADYDYQANAVPEKMLATRMEGFAAHWNINANPAHYFDRWLLNVFPRSAKLGEETAQPFIGNAGGYATLSFIPSLATMILGLLAGRIMRETPTAGRRIASLVGIAAVLLAAGLAIHATGVCPIVKRIWTPSWALYSGGWCYLVLASLYAVIDVLGFRRWAFPGIVAGMNPITLYVMSGLLSGWVLENLNRLLGRDFFANVGGVYAPILQSFAVVAVLWLICYWMYRNRWFIRI